MNFIFWLDFYIGKQAIGRFGIGKDKKFSMVPLTPKWKDACDDLFKEITERNEKLSGFYKKDNLPPVFLLKNIQRWYNHSGRIGVSKLQQKGYRDE